MSSQYKQILFRKNISRFRHIQEIAAGFSRTYGGAKIIQDDVFAIIENYAKTKDVPLEWLRFPIEDKELCACTFVRGGRIFVLINAGIALNEQIFAAAHELYHIRCFLEEDETELIEKGSILDSRTIDANTTEEEELEANAFASSLLVQKDDLRQQMDIYQIDPQNIKTDDIVMLMDIFAVPYKAVVLRLLEEKLIEEKKVEALLSVPMGNIEKWIKITGRAKRWNKIPTDCEQFGTLRENLLENKENESLPEGRIESDMKRLQEIMAKYGINENDD